MISPEWVGFDPWHGTFSPVVPSLSVTLSANLSSIYMHVWGACELVASRNSRVTISTKKLQGWCHGENTIGSEASGGKKTGKQSRFTLVIGVFCGRLWLLLNTTELSGAFCGMCWCQSSVRNVDHRKGIHMELIRCRERKG